MESQLLSDFVKCYVSLFIVMDAIGNAPLFLSLTSDMARKKRISLLNKAILVASFLILAFIVAGNKILIFFGITVPDFQVAGGLVFLLLGIEMVFGLKFLSPAEKNYNIAIVPLATPLIAGPGVLTTVVVLTSTYGYPATFAAAILNLLSQRIILGNSVFISKWFGKQGSELLTRIMGIVLTALAISFIRKGLATMIAGG